jgi:ketosteroid isomerase-like protein
MPGKDLDSRQDIARSYYSALDEGDYDLLADLLDASFVHERPDMVLEGRDRFLRFMREERPTPDTSHEIDGVYRGADGDGLVVRGRLFAPDGSLIVQFADAFSFEGTRIARIETYSR